jgi:gliding motility-associated-like protein
VPARGTGVWRTLSGNISLSDSLSPMLNLTPDTGNYILEWKVQNGICPANSDTVKITRFATPPPAAAGEDIVTESPDVGLDAKLTGGQGVWTILEGNCSIDDPHNPQTTIRNIAAEKTVLRWTINAYYCPVTSDDITVLFKPFSIPNGFSPNGDGINDQFEITSLSKYRNVRLTIFNRWGLQVYENPDYKNNWDGRNSQGQLLPDDTYYFILEVPSYKNLSGFIILKQNP